MNTISSEDTHYPGTAVNLKSQVKSSQIVYSLNLLYTNGNMRSNIKIMVQ